MCDQYNNPFEVPEYSGGSGVDWTPVLGPIPAPCAFVHPVTACQIRCREIAKAKHAECRMKVKQFKQYMKTQGCPGTWCATKKKSHCAKRMASKKKKASKKK